MNEKIKEEEDSQKEQTKWMELRREIGESNERVIEETMDNNENNQERKVLPPNPRTSVTPSRPLPFLNQKPVN